MIVLFLYLYKKQFHLFCGELQVRERHPVFHQHSVHPKLVSALLDGGQDTQEPAGPPQRPGEGSESTGEMGSWAMADFKADFSTPFFKEFSLFQVEITNAGRNKFYNRLHKASHCQMETEACLNQM